LFIYTVIFEHSLKISRSGISIGSGLLLGAIVMEKALRHRKEMQIIVTLCIADLVYGFAGFIMNIYRVILMAIGLSLMESSSWDCIKYPQTFLQNVGQQLVAYMNLVVSIDRLANLIFWSQSCLSSMLIHEVKMTPFLTHFLMLIMNPITEI
jgi:hypothetical protein